MDDYRDPVVESCCYRCGREILITVTVECDCIIDDHYKQHYFRWQGEGVGKNNAPVFPEWEEIDCACGCKVKPPHLSVKNWMYKRRTVDGINIDICRVYDDEKSRYTPGGSRPRVKNVRRFHNKAETEENKKRKYEMLRREQATHQR